MNRSSDSRPANTGSDRQTAWLDNPATGARVSLPGRGEFTLGRDPTSDIPLDAPEVSWSHAVLASHDARWWLRDVGSTNGTYVNDRRVSSPTQLSDGARLVLGEATLIFHQPADTPTAPHDSAHARRQPGARKKRRPLAAAIITALILWVVGLLANAANTYFVTLNNSLLTWLLPNVVGGLVVVIGAIVSHFGSSDRASPASPPSADSPAAPPTLSAATVLGIVLVLGVVALGATLGVRYLVGYATGREAPVTERFDGRKSGTNDGIKLTVTKVYETKHFTQVEVTANNTGDRPQTLPLYGYCVLNGDGKTLKADPFRSQWSETLPTGVEQSGTITFVGHLTDDPQRATLSFTFGTQHQVKGIKLTAGT